ncbi:methylated-DNA--protein-cysteine methyltransferase [Neocloeon triangulifer]|uniref:methylated-DNA--protein-cysteine methyltransferase n=1 Tax=Neocloeon triangulifer TaxID=2078957 RepID=UPI00286F7285|nr:methylated-DNA--protein-cysteine methyltransferase [Neocloeon triangulifer]
MKICSNGQWRAEVSSPIGNIVIEFCSVGLHSVNQSPEISDSNFKPAPSQEVTLLSGNNKYGHLKECINWLDTYFHNPTKISEVKFPSFCTINSATDAPFFDKVYTALLKVPFGNTVSYKELATLAGSPNATRAAGTAMAKNPFQLIVPCHRVLPSTSASGKQQVGNYSSGKKVSVKEWLLVHEGHNLSNRVLLKSEK